MAEQTNRTSRPRGPRGPMGGMMAVQKPKNFKASFKKLLTILRPYFPAMLVALLFAVGGTILNVLSPKYLGNMTNVIQEGAIFGENYQFLGFKIDMAKMARIGIMLIIFYVLSAVFTYIQGYIMNEITQKITKRLRTDISEKINRLPLSYFDNTSIGDVLSRVTNDVDTIGQTLSQSLSNMITAITTIIGVPIMMLTISPILTLVPLVSIPVSLIVVMLIVKFSQKHFKNQQEYLGDINGQIEEIYSAHNVVRVFNGTEKATKEFEENNQKLYRSAWKSQFISGLMIPFMNFLGNLSYVLVCIFGAQLALNNKIKIGAIQSFITYIRQFNQPLSQVASIANVLQSTVAASERVFEFLEEKEQEEEVGKTEKLAIVKGNVTFDHVSFGYKPDREIIHDLNVNIKAGQKVAIVGPTGAGKTTIVNLLMRFYEVSGGDIKVDGVSLKDMTREDCRDLFGMVLQDTWLFQGTIRENIAFGRTDLSSEEIEKACSFAHIDYFIRSLPNGYDMVLDESANISQGQRQLLTIARAMVQNNPMMILDEATSSVDTRTEILIQKAMDKLTEGRTSFVIAHRLSTIKNADLILVMKEGDVVEMGKHDELLAKHGFYHDLYMAQFEGRS